METLSVNAAIERLDELAETDVAIFGQLSLDFEGQCISHLPRSERLAESEFGMYTSSIWTRFDLGAIGQREQWLMQFDARNVVLHGAFYGPDPGYGGCGHFCLWPAGLVVRAIAKR
ncbi:hypothetical protein [Neorhodopirellula lusitana]|uniref:hypothetical protein n=1 Tax=Neorhodopirellula lusitana TaxID=445327 RepID=UPI00384FC6FB